MTIHTRTSRLGRLLIPLVALSTPLLAAPAAEAVATSLEVTFEGCSLRFVTVGGEGVLDYFSATASVDGGPPAVLWADLADDVSLANHVQVEFATGSSLTVQWVLEDDDEQVLAQGTDTFIVPACDPPYRLRIDKVAAGTAPSGDVTVRVWPGLGDGGLDCGVAPPDDAITVTLPASGGSQVVRVTVGAWCVSETNSRGASSVGYASVGGTTNGGFHVADVAYLVDPGAPVVRVVTVTNGYPGSASPQLPATGLGGWPAGAAVILLVGGGGLVAATRRRQRRPAVR